MTKKRKVIIEFTFSTNYPEEEFISSLDSWLNDFMDTEMADTLTYEVIED